MRRGAAAGWPQAANWPKWPDALTRVCLISSLHLERRIYVARGAILAEITAISIRVSLDARACGTRESASTSHSHVETPPTVIQKFDDISRYLPRISDYATTIVATTAAEDAFNNSRAALDNLDIARRVLATSMRRFHSSFRIFSICLVPFRPAHRSLFLPAGLTCCCADASCPYI